jgi:phosphatidylglycerophosphate synthase
MTFKAATCPSCGGALQVPEDRTTVKCVYCDVDVILREDTQSAAMKATEEIAGTVVKSAPTAKGFAKALIGFGVVTLLFSLALLAQAYDKTYGAIAMVVALVSIITGVINL